MTASITDTLIKKLKGQDVTVFDTGQPGLQLRLRASGVHTYRVGLGRGKFLTLGRQDVLTVDDARKLAREKLRDRDKGIDVLALKRQTRGLTFSTFVTDHYEPWAKTHLRSIASTVGALTRQFVPLFGEKPLVAIDAFSVERWRTGRIKAGKVKTVTVHKELASLKAALAKAVEWKLLPDHPLRNVKATKRDDRQVVRYLTAEEEQALRAALQARDDGRRQARERANAWRRERGYKLWPAIGTYSDHMTPIVLLALNTGLRRGELLALRWEDITFSRALLTVRGEHAKSGRTRHIPLNAEAIAVLQAWQTEATSDLVFPGENGETMFSLKTAWATIAKRAGLKDFRFHDLRHSFASKLVQAGVDLNTVRELLGHSDFKLTLRYAHLRPDNLSAAVAKLAGA